MTTYATKKITDLAEATTWARGDLLAMVSDPGASPITKKIAIEHVIGEFTYGCVFDGGGSEIADGKKGYILVRDACNIIGWTILADQVGEIQIDVWKDVVANYPPTDADSITNSQEPTVPLVGTGTGTDDYATSTDLSAWAGYVAPGVPVAAGDVICFNVDSCTTITWAVIQLHCEKK